MYSLFLLSKKHRGCQEAKTLVKMFTILLIALSALSLANGDNSCPPEDAVHPCFCYLEEENDNRPVLLCAHVIGMETIRKVLDAVKGKDIAVAIEGMTIGEVPSDLFKGQVFSEINFEECSITSFGDVPFSGLEDSLKKLGIFSSFDGTTMNTKTLKLDHLRKLEIFEFEENDFQRIDNDWFASGPTTLRQVNLEVNNLEELGDKVFAPLVNLEQVWFGDNSLKHVSRSMFPNPATKLALLEMGLLELQSLPEDIFEGMPALKIINLTGNQLVTLPQNTWKPIWNQLEEVYVDYNREFVCDKQIRWIYEGKLPKTLHGTCFGNNALTGKKLADLTLSDFD